VDTDVVVGDTQDDGGPIPFQCPEGQTWRYGNCVVVDDGSGSSDGCTASPNARSSAPGAALLLLTLAAGLAARARRKNAV
jgi:MYXO-CTERM domain-containing protein